MRPARSPGWNVAQALGHAFAARDGLVTAAALAAAGRFPPDAPRVVPGVPGPADATREDLARRLALSRRIVARSARSVAGHELDACPLEHPLVGTLRCGEGFLFAAVHDLMHLEQLANLAARLAGAADAGAADAGPADAAPAVAGAPAAPPDAPAAPPDAPAAPPDAPAAGDRRP